jgi:hypothetical protein
MNSSNQKTDQKQTAAVQVPDIGKKALRNMLNQVEQFASIENTPLTKKEMTYASDIVMAVIKRVEESKVSWNDVDIKDVVGQIKRYARLGLSITENELYVDMRNNGKTGKKEINIKKQYQGIEKELIKWCSKKIIRFYGGIICEGDEFETEVDFETGIEKVVSHKKNKSVDRNKLENITGAYKIAYIEENGNLVQYPVIIDRNRIMRAYNASPTNEKPIWKADTQRMVLKTTSWCLYNYVLRPFVNIPVELKSDWAKTQDEMNFDSIAEAEVIAQEEVAINANTGEVLDIPQSPIPPVQDLDDIPTEPKEEDPF